MKLSRKALVIALASLGTSIAFAADNLPTRVLFGDTHLHTSYSTDSGLLGNRLGPEEAYRFARGEEVITSTGLRAKLARPLDFLVVADHAENLGLAPMIAESDPGLLATEFGKRVHGLVQSGKALEAMTAAIQGMITGRDPLQGNPALVKNIWQRITTAAESYNDPGKFTALIGYEWSSGPQGNNLHRVVVFRDDKRKADQTRPFSLYDSSDPEDLWRNMAEYEKQTGGKVLAIPHNGNLSNGLMFDNITLTSKKPIDRDYATRRARWEPLMEVTQMKGDSETHTALSTNDEFADFERWDKGSFGPIPKTAAMLPNEYARATLKRGLAFENSLGANPFKFGMIGSTDSHTSLATTDADNFYGKAALVEPSPNPRRFDEKITGQVKSLDGSDITMRHFQAASSGLAAVWATDNTREAIWDAMARKEVYATTGTRLTVRVFAGWNFSAADLMHPDFAKRGYAKGVPMGGDLPIAQGKGKTPVLLIQAARDANGAYLDRVQVVKGWQDAAGELHEKVYDVSWAGQADKSRQPDPQGKLPPVGNTVDVANASYSNSIGAPRLSVAWRDPAFKATERAFYYVRVLEIPTPRWTTYDAKRFGVKLPEGVPTSLQQRAYTSPIWYSPSL